MAQTPEKLYRMMRAVMMPVQRPYSGVPGQQHESPEHQRGGVDEDTARVDMHPDHAVGIHGAESEHPARGRGRTHRSHPQDPTT